ncbi:MAG: hypothetical protein ACO1G9_10045 [Bacteroidota bacterium]
MKNVFLKNSLITLLICVIIAGLFYFFNRDSWQKTYKSDEKNPYDTFLIHEILFNKFNKSFNRDYKQISDSSIKEFGNGNVNYVFIGKQLFQDSAEQSNLLAFVARGNTAFISVNYIPQILYPFQFTKDTTYSDSTDGDLYIDQFQSDYLKTIKVKLEHQADSLEFPNVYNNKIIPEEYAYFNSEDEYNERTKVLGRFNGGLINFISYEYGKGKFLLHTTPPTFSNYALSKEENLAYADFVFSHLDPEKGIFWDEYNKTYHFNYQRRTYEEEEESPLRYILSQQGLRYAWYLALVLLALYVAFVGKRRQRPIPVLEKTRNTSLEFIKTVGKLYYSERDHRGICIHKMKLFNNFLRSRYFINANTITDELKERISTVSGVGMENVNKIYTSYFWIEKQIEIDDSDLIEFATAINNFYKQCK